MWCKDIEGRQQMWMLLKEVRNATLIARSGLKTPQWNAIQLTMSSRIVLDGVGMERVTGRARPDPYLNANGMEGTSETTRLGFSTTNGVWTVPGSYDSNPGDRAY